MAYVPCASHDVDVRIVVTDLSKENTCKKSPMGNSTQSATQEHYSAASTAMASAAALMTAALVLTCTTLAIGVSLPRSLVIVVDNNETVSITYEEANGNASRSSSDLSLQALARSVPGVGPDQVHLKYWGNNSYLISWATGDGQVGPDVLKPSTSSIESRVYLGTSPLVNGSDTGGHDGIVLTYLYDYSKDIVTTKGVTYHAMNYASPVLHHVLVEGLAPGTTYYYRVGDPRFFFGLSDVFKFTTIPGPGTLPFKLGVMADVGQTSNTTEMQGRMLHAEMDALALIGDFSYADNYGASGCQVYDERATDTLCPFRTEEAQPGQQTYQPRWDTWGRLWQKVLARVPFIFANGNHEIEELPSGARFVSYNARFPGPPAAGIYAPTLTNQAYLRTIVQEQPAVSEFDPLAAYHNMFYAVTVPGATVIQITTFIVGDTFNTTTMQYQWLERTLAAVDRAVTPWVILTFHYPVYTSYAGAYKGIECFRQQYEPLWYKYGVDIVFNGHVHAYERSHPVYDLQRDTCGPVHIVVGDGGNSEGVSKDFADTYANVTAFCQPGKATTRTFPKYQPQACWSWNPVTGDYCDTTQPVWSAYRNPSWGFGVLEILNSTTAHWIWNDTDNNSTVTDDVFFMRNTAFCTNKGGGDRRR